MVVTDTISDYLTRVRNALMRGKEKVVVPYSKLKEATTDVMVEQGYLEDYQVNEDPDSPEVKEIEIELKYTDKNQPVITGMERVSSPGQRIYSSAQDIEEVLSGYGVAIISTSHGVMTDDEARESNVGGEILFKVW